MADDVTPPPASPDLDASPIDAVIEDNTTPVAVGFAARDSVLGTPLFTDSDSDAEDAVLSGPIVLRPLTASSSDDANSDAGDSMGNNLGDADADADATDDETDDEAEPDDAQDAVDDQTAELTNEEGDAEDFAAPGGLLKKKKCPHLKAGVKITRVKRLLATKVKKGVVCQVR